MAFYQDDYDVNVIELGSGDTHIAGGLCGDLKKGTVSFIDNCGLKCEIGGDYKISEMTSDVELNTVCRLLFTKTESIDVLIQELEKTKKFMQNPESHPWHDKIKEEFPMGS